MIFEEKKKKTYRLLGGFVAVIALPSLLIGGVGLMVILGGIAAALSYFAYYYSHRLVLRMFRAVPIKGDTDLYKAVARVAKKAEMPIPRMYIMKSSQPNAFATGREPRMASIAVTTGLLEQLNSLEVSAILAHEMAHIRHGDTIPTAVAGLIAGGISMPANLNLFDEDAEYHPQTRFGEWVLRSIAKLAAWLAKLVVDPEADFAADMEAAKIIDHPEMLATALRKADRFARRAILVRAEKIPGASSMFTVHPLSGQGMDDYFTFHPPIEERVARLRAMVQEDAA